MGKDPFSLMSCLSYSPFFRIFNSLIGAHHARSILVHEHIRAREGLSVLDIGCGMADVLDFLPEVRYTGFDASASYIAAAKRRFGNRGTFLHLSLENTKPEQFQGFDLVLAMGILHHLPDPEAIRLLELARSALVPRGRLVTFDGCYTQGQSRVVRTILSLDRGAFVRDAKAFFALASQVFPHVGMTLRHDLLRIPYTHLIMECSRTESK